MTSTQADALVEMGNAGPSRRRARTTGTDAVVAAVKHAVPPRRRDAVLKRLLADARRAFAARSGGVALERAKAELHGVGEARSVVRGSGRGAIPRSKLVPVVPLYSQAWRYHAPRSPSVRKPWAAPSPLPSPAWTAVSAAGRAADGPLTPSGKRVWTMVAGKRSRRAAAAGRRASLAERVQALYRREVDRAQRRKTAARDARLVARGVLSPSAAAKPPPSTCRTRRSVSFSRDLLVEEG